MPHGWGAARGRVLGRARPGVPSLGVPAGLGAEGGGGLLGAVDGTTVGAADSAANAAAFGRPGSRKQAASPAIRLVVLLACGTRGLLDAAFGPVRGKGTGEQALAGQLLGHLRKGMLLLADRNSCSWALWHAAAGTGADLLWRAKASM